jgi:16S rRNA processing protein RimM
LTEPLVCLGEIVGVHGIKGQVKIKLFGDDPKALTSLSPLSDARGKEICEVLSVAAHGNIFLARLKGIDDRTAAEKWRGVKLHASRARLPKIRDKDTFYHADLVGLDVSDTRGKALGRVIAVANFGVGDLLEIAPPQGASFYFPFTEQAVPTVDIAAKKITVDPPPGLLDD